MPLALPVAVVCVAPRVIDGDGFRCANLGEVRLIGIDAADYRGSRPCRGHFGDHVCDDASAERAKASLKRALRLGPVRVTGVDRDRYGRMVASATAGGRDLSCLQIERGVVRYIAGYDTGGRVVRACGGVKPRR
jgi:endonuclease YncB( thermonuclease family)